MPVQLGREEFEELVADALDEIPDEIAALIQNVVVLVDLTHAGRADHPERVEPAVGQHVPHALRGGVEDALDGGHVREGTRQSDRHTPETGPAPVD